MSASNEREERGRDNLKKTFIVWLTNTTEISQAKKTINILDRVTAPKRHDNSVEREKGEK